MCYCFDNAYLELLWEVDRGAITSPAVARTRLAERAEWRRTGASPFGIALRHASSPEAPLPFATWEYQAPFLPQGLAIPVALASDDPGQPFLFRSPGNERPGRWRDGRAGVRQRPAGLAEIVGLRLDFPAGTCAAADVQRLRDIGLAVLNGVRAGPRLELTLSRIGGGPPRHLSLPDFSWSA